MALPDILNSLPHIPSSAHNTNTNMPGEIIDRPNPPPGKSQLPDSLLNLEITLDTTGSLTEKEKNAIQKFRRMANYIAAAMIFLKDNVSIERDIKFEDIKPRLLGHWGTCPGLTLVYAHLNLLIKKENEKMIFVVGPGSFTSAWSWCAIVDVVSRSRSTRHPRLPLDRRIPYQVLPSIRHGRDWAQKSYCGVLYTERVSFSY